MDKLIKGIEEDAERRGNFSRRRLYDPEQGGVFVNERNRKFNEKLYRYFGEHVKDLYGEVKKK